MGEYNGEILKAMCYYHNMTMDDLIDIFYYWATVQWLPPGKGTSEASEIRREDAVGIAHTAGLFSPVVRSAFMSGSVRFAGENADGTDSEQSVQAFNPKFYFINGVLHYFNLDIDESMINTSACVVQEGEVLKLVDFTRKEGVVQGKLFADGTFSIPKQQCGKDDKYGYEYIISGSEDENADEEIKGRFEATHLYFDTPFYVYKYKRDDETGELTYNGTDSYYTPSIELYDGSTLTVPGESSGIKALPNDDKQKRADVMYDLQGRRVNPKAAGKGIYIKGKKYILK
jgi:hypothetical protein